MSLERDIGYLRQVPLLAEFADEQLRLLAFSAENKRLSQGEELFAEGQRTEAGYVIVSGEIALTTEDGERTRTLGVFGPGSLLGEMALFTETARPNTAVARSDCEVIRIRRALFKRMLQEYPEIAASMQVRMAKRVRGTAAQISRIGDRLEELGDLDAAATPKGGA